MRLILAVILSFSVSAGIYASSDLKLTLNGMGSAGPYRLNHTHILVNSEQVMLNGAKLSRNADYRIDYNDGFLMFFKSIGQADTLEIHYKVVPIEIRDSYTLRKPVAYEESDTALYTQTPSTPKQPGGNLDIVGSKGFAINIGNVGEPSLTQSLDLGITGQLTRDVFVRGSVSDRNFGASSSGASRSLDELDKIFLSIESKHFRGDFGDLELAGLSGSLLDYRRKLTGLNLNANGGNFSGSTALAFSPGKQVEIFFFGINGKQGPYILNAPGVSTSAVTGEVFLAGTEEVYLDGVILARGSENDYVIDYYERYIQFTPRNVITSNSRITVKIQLAPEGYRRSFYHVNAIRDGKFQIGVQYIGEHDDKASPRNFDIGTAEREAIADAGQFQDSAFVSGADFVGSGAGDYVLAVDSLGVSYYEYVGPDSGDYRVSFSRVGQGLGDYEYAGTGKYLYVGDAKGSYQPIIYYPLPETRDHGSIFFKRSGDIYVNSELAVSRYNRNSLSDKDELLVGAGFLGTAGVKKSNIDFFNRTINAEIFNLKIRSLDSEFSSPGIIDQPEFFRDYNLPEIRTVAGERLYEIHSGAVSQSSERLLFGGGVFDGDLYRAKRAFARFNLLVRDGLMFIGNSELAGSEEKSSGRSSDWNKYETGLETLRGRIRPAIFYRHELKDGIFSTADGYLADEYEASIAADPLNRISTVSKIIYREQQHVDSAENREREFDRYKIEQEIKYGRTGSRFTAEFKYARMYQENYFPLSEKLTRNMGDFKLNYNIPDFGFTFYESVNAAGRILRAREYVFVGDGKGDFRRDGDDYVPEPGGDYIEVIRNLGEGEVGSLGNYEISGGLRVRLNARILTSDKILSRISYDSDLNHRTNLSDAEQLQLKYLSPISRFNPDDMTYKTYDFRQRTTFKLNMSGDYVRHTLKLSRSDGSNYQFENLSDRANSNAADIRLFSRSSIGFQAAGEYASEKKWLYSGNVDLIKTLIRFVPDFRPLNTVRVEIPLEYAAEKERIKNLKIDSYAIGIKTTLNIRNYGRFEFDGGYTRVELDGQNLFIPYIVAGGKKPGDNFNGLVTARFKLNSYSRMEFRYTYKELGDGYNNSTLRLEARAEF